MATYVKYDAFVENLAEGVHDLGSDDLDIALTNRAPVSSSDALLSDISEITGDGYTSGANNASISASSQSSGTYKLVVNDVVITASGGTIGPFRYVVLYNDTPITPLNPLIAYHDYGPGGVTLANTETFTWDADASTGILTIA